MSIIRAELDFLRYGERREHCPVADFEFLIDVMEVLFDSAVGNIQPAPNFLVRQPLGYQTHYLSLALREHRQVIQNAVDVGRRPPVWIDQVRAIGCQAAAGGEVAKWIDRNHAMLGSELD